MIEVLLMERAREQLRALKFDAPYGGGVQGQRQDPTSVKRPTDSPKVKIYLDSGNTQKEKL